MSETQQKSAVNLPGESLVVVGQTGSENTQPYRPNELEEDSIELHHNRSKAPAVPSFTEELKVKNDESYTIETIEPAEIEAVIEDKPKHQAAKKISSSIKKRDISPEAIILAPIETQIKKTAPVPDIDILKTSSQTKVDEIQKENVADVESTLGDVIVELRTPEVAKPNPEWSDDEEASGLPRSASRSSRMSRAMRQLFCCGVPYHAASEENLSPTPPRSGI